MWLPFRNCSNYIWNASVSGVPIREQPRPFHRSSYACLRCHTFHFIAKGLISWWNQHIKGEFANIIIFKVAKPIEFQYFLITVWRSRNNTHIGLWKSIDRRWWWHDDDKNNNINNNAVDRPFDRQADRQTQCRVKVERDCNETYISLISYRRIAINLNKFQWNVFPSSVRCDVPMCDYDSNGDQCRCRCVRACVNMPKPRARDRRGNTNIPWAQTLNGDVEIDLDDHMSLDQTTD